MKKNMKRHIIVASVNFILLVAFVTCLIISNAITTPLYSQQAARSWAGQSGERFAQLSVFFSDSVTFNEEMRFEIHKALNAALLVVSMENTEERTMYTDAWSGDGVVQILGERGNSVSAPVIAVGGDYFLFHPLNLRSGSYLNPNDIMKDKILIDEDLAWRLFGSVHLAGLEVMINNKPFIISGVISREVDFASTRAHDGTAGMYMPIETLEALTETTIRVNSYEIVMPDPITGFAFNTLSAAVNNPGVSIVENSNRFTLGNYINIIRDFGDRSMRELAVEYPYWENAARFAEDWATLLFVISILLLVCPIICAIVYLIIFILFDIKHGKNALSKIIGKHEKRAYEKYRKTHQDIPDIYNLDDIIEEVKDGEI
ncbi:MAG: ABC transporter permease [Oscillospiraceae bacterium]|jgi:hypothetical protein|nr:ABC transporter permease [Oscillospiraceae bacterium]